MRMWEYNILIYSTFTIFRISPHLLRDGGSGYRIYVFEESIRRYTINCKGQGHKEVIYLYIADISCTRGVRESIGLSYRGPYSRVL